jgi:hypothetical protein
MRTIVHTFPFVKVLRRPLDVKMYSPFFLTEPCSQGTNPFSGGQGHFIYFSYFL